MKVFVIGATGYIGNAVSRKLQKAGHRIIGLARSKRAEAELLADGMEAHKGELEDLESIAEGARNADAVIHCAMHFDKSQTLEDALVLDRKVAETIVSALAGTNKKYIYNSGTYVVAELTGGEPSAKIYSEEAALNPAPFIATRAKTEQFVLDASQKGVHTIVIRPPLVYGHGASIQIPHLITDATKQGVSRYVGKGENIWSAVHVDDLADLFVLALEKSPKGQLFNAGSNEASMKDIAQAISVALGFAGKTKSATKEEVEKDWGSLFAITHAANSRINSEKAGKILGWQPKCPSLLEEIEHGSYRKVPARR